MFSVKVGSAETGIQVVTKALQSLYYGQQLSLTLKTSKTPFQHTHLLNFPCELKECSRVFTL